MKFITLILFFYSYNLFGVTEIHNFATTLDFISEKGGQGYLFLGHGSSGQLENIEQVNQDIDLIVSQINDLSGEGEWVAIFGGDNYSKNKPDIGYILHRMKSKYNIPILAIQASKVRDSYGGVDQHIDKVFYYPTQMEEVLDSKTGENKMKTLWGGLRENLPVGATKYYLGDEIVLKKLLKGVIAFGGGKITEQEIAHALKLNVPLTYIQTKALFPPEGQPFGAIHSWMLSLCESGRLSKKIKSIFHKQ